jgi:hypothetical protein
MRSLFSDSRALWFGVVAVLGTACGAADPGDSSSTPAEDNSRGTMDEAPVTAAANLSFTCLQTSSGRVAYKQKVTAQVDANGVPVDIRVFRGPTLKLEHQASIGVKVPDYSDGYFKINNHLDAFSIGSETINDYYLLLPEAGITGAPFVAQLHLYFDHGNFGWWQKAMSCTVP